LNVLQSDLRDRTAALLQRRVVSLGLRVDEAREPELLPRDRQLGAGVVDDLEEAADRRAALVQLPGRVQVPRPEAEGDDAVGLRPDPLDERPEPLLLCGVDERLDRDVVPGLGLLEQPLHPPLWTGDSPLALAGKDLAGPVLRRLHVRLVERVDLEDRAGDRGRELPPEELRAEGVPPVQLDLARLAVGAFR